MSKIRIKVSRKEVYRRVQSGYVEKTKKAIQQSAIMVHATAVQSITGGNKSGETYQLYNPRRIHTASAPGEAPAADTGYLHSNIIFDIDADGLGASIESRADYSAALEFGTSKMQARPFLQPAVEENRPKIKRLMRQTIRRPI